MLSDGAFLDGVKAAYAAIDRAVESLGASCAACGRCCKFDLAGHLLYVTAGELALLRTAPLPAGAEFRPLRCPYQLGSQCTARALRPLGCRAYSCGGEASKPRSTAAWSLGDVKHRSMALYEQYHAELRRLHERHSAPYAYVELTGALMELSGLSAGAAEARTKTLT